MVEPLKALTEQCSALVALTGRRPDLTMHRISRRVARPPTCSLDGQVFRASTSYDELLLSHMISVLLARAMRKPTGPTATRMWSTSLTAASTNDTFNLFGIARVTTEAALPNCHP